MLEAYFRPLYQVCLVDPVAKNFPKLSPLIFTITACVSGMLVLPALFFNFTTLALFFLLFSGFFDTLDGTVARQNNQVTIMGSIFDIVSDRVVEIFVMLGLFIIDPMQRAFSMFSLFGACYLCITCFLVVGIFAPNNSQKSFYYSPGLIERTEVFLFFIAMIIWPHCFNVFAYTLAVLILLTSFLHLKRFYVFQSSRKR